MTETIRCSHCKAELPAESYSRNSRKPSGRAAYCRPCQSIYSYHRQHRKEHLLQGLKFCTNCWALQPLDHFDYDPHGYGGRAGRCRVCEAQFQRKRAEQRAEKERLKQQAKRERLRRVPRPGRSLGQFAAFM